MKIQLNEIDTSEKGFRVQEREIGGETVFLVTPNHIGTKWSKDTLHFRSSVWDTDGNLVSASFPKFFNWGEQPDIIPLPESLEGCVLVEKLDGSCLIVSKWKGNVIARTRGTVDASQLNNGHEIELLKSKYPKVFDNPFLDNYSLIFEWMTPTNTIVVRHPEPEIKLIGMIFHDFYSLVNQSMLDVVARTLKVERPKRFNFDSIDEMIDSIKELHGKEGICAYSDCDSKIHKIKSAWYLALHRFKECASFKNVLDMFCSLGFPTYDDFRDHIGNTFDWECFKMVDEDAKQIVKSYEEILEFIDEAKELAESISHLSRKDIALFIRNKYDKFEIPIFFMILDGKEIDMRKQMERKCAS